MLLHILGVNGPYPESNGATSGYLLCTEKARLQFDLGSGVLGRLTALTPPEDLDALFLSHWHFDHASDILPLIYRLDPSGKPLDVYAPADEQSPLRRILLSCAGFRLHDTAAGDVLKIGDAEITVTPARHPVPAVGFRVSDGKKVFGYTGDTNTLPGLADHYRGCGLLLADALFPEESWGEGKPHLSAPLAAALARDAGVSRLVLTHLNPSYSPALLLREARGIFSESVLARAGDMLMI